MIGISTTHATWAKSQRVVHVDRIEEGEVVGSTTCPNFDHDVHDALPC
jgi:hypothetical protein